MPLDKLSELNSALLAFDKEVTAFFSGQPSVEDSCELLVKFNMFKRDVSTVYDTLSAKVADVMGSAENISLQDGSSVEKKMAYSRKSWKHDVLANVVSERIIQMSVNMDTGEITKTPQELAAEMLTYCAPSYWRVKELKTIGINPDNYCEVGDLQTSIIVRKPK